MCPRCGYTGIQCTAALLKDSCLNSRISYLLDNSLTIFYAIFISCWCKCKNNSSYNIVPFLFSSDFIYRVMAEKTNYIAVSLGSASRTDR